MDKNPLWTKQNYESHLWDAAGCAVCVRARETRNGGNGQIRLQGGGGTWPLCSEITSCLKLSSRTAMTWHLFPPKLSMPSSGLTLYFGYGNHPATWQLVTVCSPTKPWFPPALGLCILAAPAPSLAQGLKNESWTKEWILFTAGRKMMPEIVSPLPPL